MDGGNHKKIDNSKIEHTMNRREQGYIWLEEELKRDLAEGAAVVVLLFLTAFTCITIIGKKYIDTSVWVMAFTVVLLVSEYLNYNRFKRIYQGYEQIASYLEAFEDGNYEYHEQKGLMEEGIRAQILEQTERLGLAFATIKERMIEEKESTKVLVTDISHQLKTPLAALRMSLDLVSDEDSTVEERQEFLERSRGEVRKLENLMGTLTNLSRLETDMIRICPKMFSLKNTMIKAVNGVYMKAFDKKIEIVMQEFKDLKIVHDTKWTAEAFVNILDNAIKYSPAQTEIRIRVEELVSYIIIEIEDQGMGIPKEEYPFIFKRFYRGKSNIIQNVEGSGVGLYLVRRILEEQGGNVKVVPGRERGSIFVVVLPKPRYGNI